MGEAQKILILLPIAFRLRLPDQITEISETARAAGNVRSRTSSSFHDQYEVKIAVATGGTLARRIIVENRPDAIVAVACELDLTSGILDSYPIPVVGILNERPCGPCINTKVDIQRVKSAIAGFCETKRPRTV